ncbi:RAP domain-containing protein, putative [Babesia ovata]|uniref:RAP domain-containing protein, putative n=1 Tax=Babesia ovata TaxID=189622 RepID=A0A2H6K7G6_9APIC|nr:RAP domain-containing protein, putative [Babesia ovata]GBE58935.1 RAP domain-containing protein, putative [Babesia ovata]
MFCVVPRFAKQRLTTRIYDAGTKASLKVYHLQEYARYRAGLTPSASPGDSTAPGRNVRPDAARDIPLFRKIEDWRQIVAEVDECVRELSPAQLLATAIAYWRLGRVGRSEWKRLCSAAARHAYGPHANVTGISASEVALILCCYARVFNKPVHSSTSLLRWLVRDVGALNERDVCMTLFYMRRMRLIPPVLDTSEDTSSAAILRAIVLGLAAEGGNKLPKFSPGGLACLVSNITYIGHIPWGLIYHACNLIRKHAARLDPKTMAMHVRSLAMLRFPDKGTLKVFATLLDTQKPLPTATIACVLHSYAKLRFRPRKHFAALVEQVHRGIFLFQDHEVAQVAFALGQLGYRNEEVFESIFAFAENRAEHQNPQNISMLMQSFAKVGMYHRGAVNALLQQAKDTVAAFTLKQSVAVLDACVVLGHFDSDAFRALLANVTRLVEDDLPDATINQLNRIMYCLRFEHAKFVEESPPSMQTLIGLYQGHFLEAPPKEPRDALYECLEMMEAEYERNASIGPYRIDALINGVIALDLLSEAALCPLTQHPLGSVRLKTRHLKAMGYTHTTLPIKEWLAG